MGMKLYLRIVAGGGELLQLYKGTTRTCMLGDSEEEGKFKDPERNAVCY